MRAIRIRLDFDLNARVVCLGILVLSLVQVAWAVGFTEILSQVLWQKALSRQVALVAIVGALVSIGGSLLEWRQIAGYRPIIAVLFIALALAIYGMIPVLAVTAFLMASLALGCQVSAALRVERSDGLTNFLTGAAILTLLNSAIAPLPVNNYAAHSMLMALPLILCACIPQCRERFVQYSHSLTLFMRERGRPGAISTAIRVWLTILALWIAIIGALPELYHDGLAVHLYIASYMAAHGQWSYDSSLFAFAFMPAAITHLYAHFFILAGEAGARLFNVVSLLLVCLTIVRLAQTCAVRNAALAAAALFASAPLASIETASLFVENGLALWIVGAVHILVQNRTRVREGAVPLLAVLAAACATKLHGAMAACIIGPIFLVQLSRQDGWRAAVTMLPGIALFALLGLFPYAYSLLLTSNPVFPFYNDIFRAADYEPSRLIDARWLSPVGLNPIYSLSIESTRFLESWNGAGGFAWLAFLPAAAIAAILSRRKTPRFCLILGLALVVMMLSQVRYLRYIYPFLPLLCVPIAYLLSTIAVGRLRYPIAACVALVAGLNAYKVPAAGWILGVVDLRAAFDAGIARQMEGALVPHRIANRMINEHGGPAARVVYVGSPLGGLLQGTAIYSNWYAAPFRREGRTVREPADALAYMSRLGVGYLVHDGSEETPFSKAMLRAVSLDRQPLLAIGRLTVWKVPPS